MSITKKIVTIFVFALFIICVSKITYASTGIVTAESLNLRESPSTSSDVKTTIKRNQEVEIINQNGKWYEVKVNKVTGYVHGDYIKIKEEPKKEEEIKEEESNIQEPVKEEKSENIKIPEQITISKKIDIYILPLINATKISQTKQNETVSVLGSTNKWLYISNNEVNGWILKSLVSDSINTQIPDDNTNTNKDTNSSQTNNNDNTQKSEKTMYVNSNSIYVRKGAGTNYDYIDTLVLNASVTVIGEEADWYKVKVNQKEGYIAKWLLSDTKKEPTSRGETSRNVENFATSQTVANNQNTNSSIGEQIVDYAKQYLGCKYVYGGSGPDTFDCSGFTMYVYNKFGISLSHSATAQSKKGTYVAKEDLKPGDIVFFKDYETMDGIGHCGIYVGNGDFIHASSGTGSCVKISTLLSGSYDTRYETARRLV